MVVYGSPIVFRLISNLSCSLDGHLRFFLKVYQWKSVQKSKLVSTRKKEDVPNLKRMICRAVLMFLERWQASLAWSILLRMLFQGTRYTWGSMCQFLSYNLLSMQLTGNFYFTITLWKNHWINNATYLRLKRWITEYRPNTKCKNSTL